LALCGVCKPFSIGRRGPRRRSRQSSTPTDSPPPASPPCARCGGGGFGVVVDCLRGPVAKRGSRETREEMRIGVLSSGGGELQTLLDKSPHASSLRVSRCDIGPGRRLASSGPAPMVSRRCERDAAPPAGDPGSSHDARRVCWPCADTVRLFQGTSSLEGAGYSNIHRARLLPEAWRQKGSMATDCAHAACWPQETDSPLQGDLLDDTTTTVGAGADGG